MEVGRLYRLKRGNQTQQVGLIIKGAAAAVVVVGSQRKPDAVSDMVLCTGTTPTLDENCWSFSVFPEYISFTGTADEIDIIGMSFEDLGGIS